MLFDGSLRGWAAVHRPLEQALLSCKATFNFSYSLLTIGMEGQYSKVPTSSSQCTERRDRVNIDPFQEELGVLYVLVLYSTQRYSS